MHRALLRSPLLAVAAAALSLAAAVPSAALPIRVSGHSPYARCRVRIARSETEYVNSEVEPYVAVDPTDRDRLIGVWQQDRLSFGGAKGLVAASSSDRGRTWSETTLPFDACAPRGLDFERASDPWVSIGPDGTAYAISISFDFFSDADNVVAAATSRDGGLTWSAPVVVHANLGAEGRSFFDDKESITADPTRPGVAYAVWDRFQSSSDRDARDRIAEIEGGRVPRGARMRTTPIWFAKTTDGGRTWSAREIYAPGAGNFTIGSEIVVDPTTDVLYDVFGLTRKGRDYVAFIRSVDGGATWSTPTLIARDRDLGVADPNTGAPLRVGALPDAAVDPRDGSLYVVWEASRHNGGQHDDIILSRSGDGGRSWTRPRRVETLTGLPAFTPAVEVNSRGIVGVSYYDLRDIGSHTRTLPTDAWLVRLRRHGERRISETKLAGPFDTLSAPFAGGYFLGDYEGLAASGRRFEALFAVANHGREHNPTDIVSELR